MQYIQNKRLLSAYIENPFDILNDQEFIFESIFNSSGFFALLKSIYRAEKFDYESKLRLYVTNIETVEVCKLILYYVARFSFRYSHLAYLNNYNVVDAIRDVAVFCKIKNLDRWSKFLLKRELSVLHKTEHAGYIPSPNSKTDRSVSLYHKAYYKAVLNKIVRLAILVEIDKISSGHLQKTMRFMREKYGESLLQIVLLEIEDHTLDGRLDPQNKSVEKIFDAAQQFMPDLFKV